MRASDVKKSELTQTVATTAPSSPTDKLAIPTKTDGPPPSPGSRGASAAVMGRFSAEIPPADVIKLKRASSPAPSPSLREPTALSNALRDKSGRYSIGEIQSRETISGKTAELKNAVGKLEAGLTKTSDPAAAASAHYVSARLYGLLSHNRMQSAIPADERSAYATKQQSAYAHADAALSDILKRNPGDEDAMTARTFLHAQPGFPKMNDAASPPA